MQETNQTISLKAQSAWLLFAKTVGFGLSFLLPLLIVRYLTQEKVGVYRQVFQVIINAVTILPLGFSMSAFYYLSRETEKRKLAVFNILIFNFVVGGLACLTLFAFPQLLGNLFHSEEITRLAPLIGIVIWLWIFSMFLETVAVANQETRLATFFIILAQFTKTALLAGAVIVFATVESFIYAAMVQAIFQTIVLLFYLNRRFPRFWEKFDGKFFLEQAIYALPFGFAALLWTLQTDIHNYFVGYHFSAAEYAIYAYGCFQVPLVAMLIESVNSVLIARLSELQASGDRLEIIRLIARAMQKLALVYFPLYVFLAIEGTTFVTTLFTKNYLASVPIFEINLLLLPLSVFITDAVFRAYEELGRVLLVIRSFILVALVAALYFGIQNLDLRGMIAIVVGAFFVDKFISTVIAWRKLGVKWKDIHLLKDVGKTAVASLMAGAFTFLFDWFFDEKIASWSANLTHTIFPSAKQSLSDFFSGVMILSLSALIFAPIYFLIMNRFGLLEDGEKSLFNKIFGRALAKRR